MESPDNRFHRLMTPAGWFVLANPWEFLHFRYLAVHAITADTFGLAKEQVQGISCMLDVLGKDAQEEAKPRFVIEPLLFSAPLEQAPGLPKPFGS